MNDDLEASRSRHPSVSGPPPEAASAAMALYARRERHARHLAEQTNMTIEAARQCIADGGLVPVVVAEGEAAGVWWCTVHNDDLNVCYAGMLNVVPDNGFDCAPVFTTAPHCLGCRVPEDQPHRAMCPRVIHPGDPEGDVAEVSDPEFQATLAASSIGQGVAALRRLTEDAPPEFPQGAMGRVEERLSYLAAPASAQLPVRRRRGVEVPPHLESLETALERAPERADLARLESVERGALPETELCGAQMPETPLLYCTKGFGHVVRGDDVHYDHRAKTTWREVPSL